MDTARTTGSPWRSWTAIAFVLVTLALIQACDSGKHTGPSSNTSLQLKLRRATGAELPAGCTGVYSVTGPGVNIQNSPLPANGQIVFQGQIGQTYTISVTVTCGTEVLSGSTQVTLGVGDNQATIILTFTQVSGVSCKPNPVGPGQDSTCTCNFQSAGAPTITWSGATPKADPRQATFNSPVSGDVSCSVNGVANGKTTVTVAQQNTISVTVQNTGCCTILVRFLGQVGSTPIDGDQSKTFNVTPPAHFQADCTFVQNPFANPIDDETLNSNTTITIDSGQCG